MKAFIVPVGRGLLQAFKYKLPFLSSGYFFNSVLGKVIKKLLSYPLHVLPGRVVFQKFSRIQIWIQRFRAIQRMALFSFAIPPTVAEHNRKLVLFCFVAHNAAYFGKFSCFAYAVYFVS